jgi:hypothetical protein
MRETCRIPASSETLARTTMPARKLKTPDFPDLMLVNPTTLDGMTTMQGW